MSSESFEPIRDFRTMDPFYPNHSKKSDNEANFFYFEFELKKFEKTKDKLKMIVIRDVSKIIKNQQSLCDQMYSDSIEANYSHE